MGRLDLIGKKYGRLTVVKFLKIEKRKSKWECICDCGGSKVTLSTNLTTGRVKSCGCLSREITIARNFKHGESKNSKEYMIWRGVYGRCMNPNTKAYPRYGGRGIKMCERWLHSYENFLIDMGRAPSDMHTLERIDNNGNYEPNNCRWATYKEQGNNTRINQCLTFNGQTKTLMQWSEELRLPYKSLWSRIFNSKWPIDKAFSEPIRKWKH